MSWPAGEGWRVFIQWVSGWMQYVSGFASRQDAENWITNESGGWLRLVEEAQLYSFDSASITCNLTPLRETGQDRDIEMVGTPFTRCTSPAPLELKWARKVVDCLAPTASSPRGRSQ
jgi:hypothetical protein